MSSERKIVYAGSFDGFTHSHMNIARDAADVIGEQGHADILVANDLDKTYWFTLEERAEMIEEVVADSGIPNLGVKILEKGLVVNYAARHGYAFMYRGIRSDPDALSERRLAMINEQLQPGIKTITGYSREEFTSSSHVKQLIRIGEGAERYVHPVVLRALGERAALLFGSDRDNS